MIVIPREEFQSCTAAEVAAALSDPDPGNPVAAEVARLVKGYVENWAAHCARVGRVAIDFVRLKPRWPIEAAAMDLASRVIREEIEKARVGLD